MTTYEITYLTVAEEAHDAPTVSGILRDAKTKIVSVHPWGGRRKLTYPIKKQDQAFYTTVVFEADTAVIQGIERALQFNNDVLRSILVIHEPGLFQRTSEDTRSDSREPKEAKEAKTEAPRTEEKEVSTEVATTEPVEETKAEAETTPAEEKPKATRGRKKATEPSPDLDKKLDELLNEDITK